ncbi:MAG: SpoIIE family protein phosphatase [Chloroflexi bacterium]|nr:SpoIIE family protein phosphatase [Chloroflexota bacterium]
MKNPIGNLWQSVFGNRKQTAEPTTALPADLPRAPTPAPEIAPNDPLLAYMQSASGVIEMDKFHLDSPAARALQANGAKLVVPLVSQGELVGLLNLGARLSEQEYSSDDHGLLANLATQAAPALRVAQLVKQQQAEALARERMEQELRVARLIQQTLLPKALPQLPGYEIATAYQPARAVGGDFYDFIELADGKIALVIADVTDKGVPAALVMATTRAILRGAAIRYSDPGQVLAQVNDLLCPDIPPNMFVTCLYAVLDPQNGQLVFANAGHDLPYRRGESAVAELRATGMPLGLMPGMVYEQKETQVAEGESILFYSDGIVEAHNPAREMFGFPRLMGLVGTHPAGISLIEYLQNELHAFTGVGWEQEDDVTMVTLVRHRGSARKGVA